MKLTLRPCLQVEVKEQGGFDSEAILRTISVAKKPADTWPLQTQDLVEVTLAIKDCPDAIKHYFVRMQILYGKYPH